ncbi:uncharacterized protein JCM10292_003016 [Rhodotorula paludigena]|uniref:uncharacterized protein n=1 Tax=Rhodotorula paludigena TaxID=86838 RepID=UPI003175B024
MSFDPSQHRPSLAVGASSSNALPTLSNQNSHTRGISIVQRGVSYLAAPSAHPPTDHSTSSDFLRNLANTRSFSQNPRARRHASLDLGVARARAGSMEVESPISTVSPVSYGEDEKRRLLSLYDSAPVSPLCTPFAPVPPRRAWWKSRRNVSAAVSAALTLFVLGGLFALSIINRPGSRTWWGMKDVLEDLGVASFEPASCENPYTEFGRIHVDRKVPENNRWLPYDPSCVPPALMATLRAARNVSAASGEPEHLTFPLPLERPPHMPGAPLSWMHGKTVLLFGDHVERNHNKDFCRFVGGKWATIGRDHALSPPRFVNGIDEKLVGSNKENYDGTRPAVCYLEDYDFMVVSVFHFGLANRVEFEHESLLHDPAFYPPVAVDDRLTHIVLPLLDSLNRTRPDLIEFSTGFWDLRHFAALDELAGKDRYGELSTERLAWYSARLTHAFADLGSAFPGAPILWRTLHQTPNFNQTSPARVAALDQISRKVAATLNEVSTRAEAEQRLDEIFHFNHRSEHHSSRGGGKNAGAPSAAHTAMLEERARVERSLVGGGLSGRSASRRPVKDRMSSKAPFLNRVKERIGSKERVKDVRLGDDDTSLRGMVRVDEWGALMRGQEHTMNNVHTPSLPGGYLWGDIMLYELRRAAALARPHVKTYARQRF